MQRMFGHCTVMVNALLVMPFESGGNVRGRHHDPGDLEQQQHGGYLDHASRERRCAFHRHESGCYHGRLPATSQRHYQQRV